MYAPTLAAWCCAVLKQRCRSSLGVWTLKSSGTFTETLIAAYSAGSTTTLVLPPRLQSFNRLANSIYRRSFLVIPVFRRAFLCLTLAQSDETQKETRNAFLKACTVSPRQSEAQWLLTTSNNLKDCVSLMSV